MVDQVFDETSRVLSTAKILSAPGRSRLRKKMRGIVGRPPVNPPADLPTFIERVKRRMVNGPGYF